MFDVFLHRCISTERQFLSDFVAGAESTAGGRLARWLAPTSRVEPSKCELKAPVSVVLPSTRVNLPVVVRDQYGDIVTSSAVKIEVLNTVMESFYLIENWFQSNPWQLKTKV